MSEANTQRSAKSFTAKLPGINRIKAVKDLLLAKLDTLLSSLSNVDIKLNALLENDSPLLQGVIALVKVTQKVQAQTNQIQAQTNQIQAQTDQIQAQTNQLQEQTNHILELLKSIQPKVVVESDADPETRLMAYLYSYLPSRCAIDIGANIGEVSNKLLEAGYE
ncbi:MAG: hypothetical protein ACP5RH_18205, partial [Leptodesmis sp.]